MASLSLSTVVNRKKVLTLIIICLFLNFDNVDCGFINGFSKLLRFQNCLEENGNGSVSLVQQNNSGEYRRLNRQFQLKPPHIEPLAFAVVKTEIEVLAIVLCGIRHQIRVVPKGGGHSFEKYSYGDSTSVVVDLRMLTEVKVDKSSMTAVVGPGNLVGPLAWKLLKAGNVLLPTGLCPTAGISGLATGGGWNYFSRMYGLATDNILEANIVTADGVLLTVNNNSKSDLFRALRGGVGSCFGIVTKFIFRVHPAPQKVFQGTLTYDVGNFAKAFNAWDQYISHCPKTVTTEFQVSNGTVRIIFVDSTGKKFNFDQMRLAFPKEGKTHKSIMPYKRFMTQQTEGLRMIPGTTKFPHLSKITRESSEQAYEFLKSFYVKVKVGFRNLSSFQNLMVEQPDGVVVWFDQYGGAINDLAPEETAFVHRGDTRYLAAAETKYTQPLPNSLQRTLGILWVKKFFELGKLIFNHEETYQNYVDEELPDFLQRYYGSNLPWLAEVKRKYDPENYFHNPQSIPTKVPQSEIIYK